MKNDRFNPIKEEELTEESVQHWAEELEKCHRRELTKDESMSLLTLMMGEKDVQTREQKKMFDEMLKSFNGVSLLWNRVEKAHTYKLTREAAIWLGSVLSSPGEATIMAAFLQYIAWSYQLKTIKIDDLCRYAFAFGLFSKEDMEKAWDAQKVEVADRGLLNMLDMKKPYTSILTIGDKTAAEEAMDKLREAKEPFFEKVISLIKNKKLKV